MYWQAPPLLIEWACVRRATTSAARLVGAPLVDGVGGFAERAEDPEFLAGHVGENIVAPVLQHARHAQRVSAGATLQSGGAGLPRNGATSSWLVYLRAAQDDIDVGAEALVRLGVLAWRERDYGRAATVLNAQRGGRWIRGCFTWPILRRTNRGRSQGPGRGRCGSIVALDAMPRAQSASVALAAIEIQTGRVREAATVIDAMLAASTPTDPWRDTRMATIASGRRCARRCATRFTHDGHTIAAALLAGTLAIAWASHVATATGPAGEQQPAFRAPGDLVSVDVSVLVTARRLRVSRLTTSSSSTTACVSACRVSNPSRCRST